MRKVFDTTKYIGIPYTNKGREMSGVDCWGLVRLIYKNEYSIDLLSFSTAYESSTDTEQVRDVVQKGKSLFDYTQKDTPEYGDIIIFNIKGRPCHAGVFVGNNKVLHVLRGTECVIERLSSHRLKGRVEGYYEIREETRSTSL